MVIVRNLVKGIDWLAEKSGTWSSALIVFIMLTMTFEVTMRYVFNAPTIWSYDVTYMLGGAFFLFPASYVLLHEGHVRVDVFYSKFSRRRKTLVDIILTPLLFFPALGVLVYHGWKFAFWSLEQGEVSMIGIWEPSMIPFRFALALGFSLLTLEAISWYICRAFFLIKGTDFIEGKTLGGGD